MRLRDLGTAIRRRSRYPSLTLAIAVRLIAFRLALPYMVKDYVNGRLHAMDAYDGSVADVGMGLWRGAYKIYGIEIVKKAGARLPTPFSSTASASTSRWSGT